MRPISVELLTEADEPTLQEIVLLETVAWGDCHTSEQIETRKQRRVEELGPLDPDTKAMLY